jgi:hypothetical protein
VFFGQGVVINIVSVFPLDTTHGWIIICRVSVISKTDIAAVHALQGVVMTGNFDADLVYSEEAPQNSNNIDTDSSLECYDHLHVYDKRETMLSENLYSSNIGFRSNTDPTYD